MPYVIRPMREADLPGRAAVHCRAWEETYRGQIPDVVLDGMTPEAIEAAVRALPMETLVVEGAEGIVGFACFCPEARAFPAAETPQRSPRCICSAQCRGWGWDAG